MRAADATFFMLGAHLALTRAVTLASTSRRFVVVVVVVVCGVRPATRYTAQLASGACKCSSHGFPSSSCRRDNRKQPPLALLQDVACPGERKVRDRVPRILRKVFYGREFYGTTFTRRLSDFYERRPDIAPRNFGALGRAASRIDLQISFAGETPLDFPLS